MTYFCTLMKPRTKYHYFNIGLTQNFMNRIRTECYQLQISRQSFVRSLIKNYFLARYGEDIDLKDRFGKNPQPEND